MILSSSAILGVETIDQTDAMEKHSKLMNEYHRVTFGITGETKDAKQSMQDELQQLIGGRGTPTEIVLGDAEKYTSDLNSVSLGELVKQTRE
jgi:hypothetical protein